MKEHIPQNFIYPDISATDLSYGAGVFGEIVLSNGDWRPYLPPTEEQRVRGTESSACYIEAQQHAIATIQEQKFNLPDQNYSARFNALLSGGQTYGGDPIKGAKSIKYDGLIPEEMMSWNGVDSWEDFHSWEGVDKRKCLEIGKSWTKKWQADFKIVAEKHYPLETKYLKLREALKRSPVPISVHAWYERNGVYYKPAGVDDTHLTEAVYLDEKNQIHVRDSYAPYDKILEANTDFDFAMYYILSQNTKQMSWWERFINALKR